MRIVSLLPSATETLFALGLGDQLVAVTHECDFPPEATRLPVVTRSTLGLDDQDSSAINALVSAAAAAERSLYAVDTDAIRALEPDLIVAQDVCHVCAVDPRQLGGELEGFPMIRQHPHSFEDVLADMQNLAAACNADGTAFMSDLRARIAAASEAAAARPRIRGVFLEWIDPPFRAGHWTPDLLQLAGIDDALGRAGVPSAPISWTAIADACPELVIIAPCGFTKERAQAEVALAQRRIDSVGASRVLVLDGSAYFNRPGPRLVDSLELLVASL